MCLIRSFCLEPHEAGGGFLLLLSRKPSKISRLNEDYSIVKLTLNWRLDNLKGDVFGGITAGIVALPLALAFGVQSGAGAIAGLYGAIALGILAATFGGTASQVSGPTGPMTVVSALVIITAIERYGSFEAGMGFIICIFILAGLIQILLGVLQLGTYIRYIPYPVVSGFMTGIGCIIILLQVFPFFGQTSPKKIIDVYQRQLAKRRENKTGN
jgi:SulP family sulfate permease